MPKFNVYIAREETNIYCIEVDTANEADAESKAWERFNEGCSSILDHGKMVHANEYVDYVEEEENEL
jgi:hypothetical protein